MEDSNPEDASSSPDTPVVGVAAPDQLVAPADALSIAPIQDNVQTGISSYPIDVFFDTNCPLSQALRNLRLETLG